MKRGYSTSKEFQLQVMDLGRIEQPRKTRAYEHLKLTRIVKSTQYELKSAAHDKKPSYSNKA